MSVDVFASLATKEFGLSKSPIGQQANIPFPSGGINQDLEARVVTVRVINRLQNIGFIE